MKAITAFWGAMIIALFIMCSGVHAEITLSGDLEFDTSYEETNDDRNNEPDIKENHFTGRINVVP